MKLIDKDALLAEIKRRKELVSDPILSGDDLMIGERNALFNLLSFIDTLEVKEVDFETAFAASIDHFDEKNNYGQWSESDLRNFAKHFFELGLKASNVLTWEDMKQIRDIMVECSAIGLWSKPDEEYYQEVVKRFKAKKGE